MGIRLHVPFINKDSFEDNGVGVEGGVGGLFTA